MIPLHARCLGSLLMLSPMLASAPFKILLFVLVDGWVLVVGTLAASINAV